MPTKRLRRKQENILFLRLLLMSVQGTTCQKSQNTVFLLFITGGLTKKENKIYLCIYICITDGKHTSLEANSTRKETSSPTSQPTASTRLEILLSNRESNKKNDTAPRSILEKKDLQTTRGVLNPLRNKKQQNQGKNMIGFCATSILFFFSSPWDYCERTKRLVRL